MRLAFTNNEAQLGSTLVGFLKLVLHTASTNMELHRNALGHQLLLNFERLNTRFLTTGKAWFGGGADLNPPLPYEEDTADFHARFRAACAAHNPTYYDRFKKWADEYFYIPHRGVHRGVGGIFYDHLECEDEAAFDRHFAFTKDVGEAFLDIYPQLVRRRMENAFTPDDKQKQLEWRGRYAEFNLVYDRGTLFGLKTGGNIDAILMSLPPLARWS